MNKDNYIKAVDEITAPDSLKEKIETAKNKAPKKSKVPYKAIGAIAACLVLVAGIFTSVNGMKMGSQKYSSDGIYNENAENGYSYANTKNKTEDMADEDADIADDGFANGTQLMSKTEAKRKVIKNAELYIQTKDYNEFISALSKKIDEFEGYTDSLDENNYSSKSAEIVVRIPSENLEKFLAGVDIIGTVQSKKISKSDVTDTYTDIESHITALDTEEKALLKILENCKTVSETIEVQSRLSEVRAEAERYKSQKKSYDSLISYSTVTISISEEERIVRTDASFFAQLKEKFIGSIYNIGDFCQSFALTVLGNILYILMVAVVAAVVIIIVKKKKKA